LSGGTLSGHISDAIAKYGNSRVALEIERVRMDFSLPATQGTGKELTAEDVQSLIEQYNPQSFLSKDLCAYYFTYHDKKGTHFVLYDNGASIKRKLSVAAKMNIEDAFIFYPHVTDIIDKIV
jgi:spore germination protein YaaH